MLDAEQNGDTALGCSVCVLDMVFWLVLQVVSPTEMKWFLILDRFGLLLLWWHGLGFSHKNAVSSWMKWNDWRVSPVFRRPKILMMKSSYCSGSYQCKVGINPVRDICWNPKLCPVCSGAFYTLTPRQQKEALAHMKHDPTKMNYKPCPLSPEEIKVIKEKYWRKSKPIKIPYKYYDIFIQEGHCQGWEERKWASFQGYTYQSSGGESDGNREREAEQGCIYFVELEREIEGWNANCVAHDRYWIAMVWRCLSKSVSLDSLVRK